MQNLRCSLTTAPSTPTTLLQHQGHVLNSISSPYRQHHLIVLLCLYERALKDTCSGLSGQQSEPEQCELCKPTTSLGSSAHISPLMPHLHCRRLNSAWLCCACLFSGCSTGITSASPVRPAFTSCYSFPPPSLLISPHDTCLSSPACPGISSSPYLKRNPSCQIPNRKQFNLPEAW